MLRARPRFPSILLLAALALPLSLTIAGRASAATPRAAKPASQRAKPRATVNGRSAAGRKTLNRRAPAFATGRKGRPGRGGKPRMFLERRVPALRGNLPNVQAQGALVIDLDSGEELYGRNADQPRAIASISKLAAGLVVMDRGLDLEAMTTISTVDTEVARGGATSRLLAGMTLSNRDLLHAAMLGSDNRAVSALGRAVGLDAAQFAAAMTRKMKQLGLTHTRFRDPTGLSPENVSTARETVRLLKAAMAHPVLGPVLGRVEYEARPVGRGVITYVNTHRPAHRASTDVLGGKTGYNNSARYCLVLAARVDGRSYGMAFLGTEGKLTRFGDVARVSDWLVTHHRRSTPEGTALATSAAAAQPALATPAATATSSLTPPPLFEQPGLLPAAPATPLLTPAVVAKPAAIETQ